MKKRFPLILTYLILVAGVLVVVSSSRVHSWWDEVTKQQLPAAENANHVIANTATNGSSNSNTSSTNTVIHVPTNSQAANTHSVTALPAEKNLNVPFTSQAPNANWDADHEEFCEEASIMMVGRFFQGRGLSDAADAERGLQEIKQWEIDHLGYYYDSTTAENMSILQGLYGLKVEEKKNPTVNDIKRVIANGQLVIVPTAGRELGNPNFKSPGPIYHNLVIRGYTKNGKFITNDPGTRKGQAYLYDQSVIMSAMHDWVPTLPRTIAGNGGVDDGQKTMLVISPGA